MKKMTQPETHQEKKGRIASLHPNLHIGTSSWSSPDWKKTGFYAESAESREYLGIYATKFDVVEVDSTYYHLPTVSTCRKWKSDTPDGFRFAMKVTKNITEGKLLEGCEREWETYLKAASELGDKLEFLVLQMSYQNKSSRCPMVGGFVKRLEKFAKLCPKGRRYVVEVRNKNWLVPDLLSALRSFGFGLALTDQSWMPRPTALVEKFGDELVTQDYVYVRFLGDHKGIEKLILDDRKDDREKDGENEPTWDKLVVDRTDETREWIPLLRRWVPNHLIWVMFNNHWAGYAPGSAGVFVREWERMK